LFVFVAALLLALPLFLSKTAARGSTTTLHSFQVGGDINEGANLNAGLILGSDGNFYGTAEFGGGTTNGGMVFKMTPSGTVTTLHSFIDNGSDGVRPMGALVEGSDGNLYGTTSAGGNSQAGTVFKITKAGTYTLLHPFQSITEGYFPVSRLIEGSDGNFYGTLSYGGSTLFSDPNLQGYGSVFKMTPAGDVTILHFFKDGSVTNDGVYPQAGLTLGSDGNFYGTTFYGGSTISIDPNQKGYGTAFRITPAGSVTILHSFNDGSIVRDGAYPTAAFTLGSDGNLYGTTLYGGLSGGGTAFKITAAGAVTVLHVFNDGSTVHDGANPMAGLTLGSDGNFYGTTQFAGSAGGGTAFKMTPAGVVTTLHSFKDGSTVNDGMNPYGDLVEGPAGNLYGTTWVNGNTDRGTVFRVDNATTVSFSVSSSGTSLAGSALTFTVTATDSDGNTLPQYRGTVHFTSSDPLATLPADATLVNGIGSFNAILRTGGSQTITATDTIRSNDTGSGNIEVTSPVDHLVVSAPGTATAGVGFNVTVTAKNQFNTTVTGYTGTIHFTSTDTNASVVLPADVTLTNGTGTFTVKLARVGTWTITATDTADSSITGTSGDIALTPGAAERFLVYGAPVSATAGSSFGFSVSALDHYGNSATGYTGTVHFTSSLAGNTLPANTTLTNGGGSFSATMFYATGQQITVTDTVNPSLTAKTSVILIKAAPADHFVVTAPGTATAGSASAVSVTAKDPYANTVTSYTGTVHFTSTDPNATLPADATLTSGAGAFNATLKTAGVQTVTATDTSNPSVTGITGNITVSPGAADHFTVTAPGTATAGSSFNVTVTARDRYNNTKTAYNGAVHFTSTDGSATLPADATLTNGAGAFSATFITAGSQTITATDTVASSIAGTSGSIAVASGAITRFAVSAPGTVTAGVPFNVTVTARDIYNNVATGYAGMVFFTTSAANNNLPATALLANGTGTFKVTFNSVGNQVIAVFDLATFSMFGVSSTINVVAGPATHFTVTTPANATSGSPVSFTVTAFDAANNAAANYTGTLHFTSTDPNAVLPADTTLTNGTGTFSVTFNTAAAITLRARDTANSSITGTATVNITAAVATHLTITAPTTASVGTVLNVTITAKDQFENTVSGYTGTIHLTSTDGQAVLPADFVLTGGTKQVSVKLRTAGTWTITATDTANASLTATTGSINVGALAAKLIITAATTATAGSSLTFTVTAKDASGNTVPSYTGTTHITSTDPNAILPADATLTNGVGTFSITFKTATTVTITATDTVTATIKGSSGGIVVSAAPASQFTVTAPASTTSGAAFYATVTAKDAYGNLAKSYTGTVHFTSTDPAAVLPANVTLTNGAKQVTVKLKTKPSQSVTATDTVDGSITGTSGSIAVN